MAVDPRGQCRADRRDGQWLIKLNGEAEPGFAATGGSGLLLIGQRLAQVSLMIVRRWPWVVTQRLGATEGWRPLHESAGEQRQIEDLEKVHLTVLLRACDCGLDARQHSSQTAQP